MNTRAAFRQKAENYYLIICKIYIGSNTTADDLCWSLLMMVIVGSVKLDAKSVDRHFYNVERLARIDRFRSPYMLSSQNRVWH